MANPKLKSALLAAGPALLSAALLCLSYPSPGWYPLAWVVQAVRHPSEGLPAAGSWWPLAWVALVPWLIVVREGSGRAALWGSVVMGLAAAGLCLSWQYVVNFWAGLGLTIYVSLYFPLFAWLVRAAVRRLRAPWMIAAPVVWVGCEFFRGFFITGLPWLYLGHTQQPFLRFIQVVDILGVPALSFIVMAANAFLVEAALMVCRRHVPPASRWQPGAAETAAVPPASRWQSDAAGTAAVPPASRWQSGAAGTAAVQFPWKRLAAGGLFVAVMVGAALGYGCWRLGHVPSREGPLVGIVQANIPQEIKNERDVEQMAQVILDHMETTKRLRGLPGGRNLDLIVWPESMVQFPLNRLDYESMAVLWAKFVALARLMGCPILIGAHAEIGDDLEIEAAADGTVESVEDGMIVVSGHRYEVPQMTDPVTGESSHRYILVRVGDHVRVGDILARTDSVVHNSAYLVRPDGTIQPGDRYDKNHLVPFGEYVPLQVLFWFVRQAVPFAKGFAPGVRLDVMTLHPRRPAGSQRDAGGTAAVPAASGGQQDAGGTAGDLRFGTLICFEGIFPGIVRDYVLRPPGEAADFLVNISNDGWFDGSPELDQHMAIAAFRAVEFRMGMVRCVNRGISSIIDPDGRIHSVVTDEAGNCKLIEGVQIGRVRLREGLTFYARHGDLLGIACTLLTALPFLAILLAPIARRFRRNRSRQQAVGS